MANGWLNEWKVNDRVYLLLYWLRPIVNGKFKLVLLEFYPFILPCLILVFLPNTYINLSLFKVDSPEAWIEDARSPEWRCSPKHWFPPSSAPDIVSLAGARRFPWASIYDLLRRLCLPDSTPFLISSVESPWTLYNCWIVSVLLVSFYFVNGFHYEWNLYMFYPIVSGEFQFWMKLEFYSFYFLMYPRDPPYLGAFG